MSLIQLPADEFLNSATADTFQNNVAGQKDDEEIISAMTSAPQGSPMRKSAYDSVPNDTHYLMPFLTVSKKYKQ